MDKSKGLELLQEFDSNARNWGYMESEGYNINDIKMSYKKYEESEEKLKKYILELEKLKKRIKK